MLGKVSSKTIFTFVNIVSESICKMQDKDTFKSILKTEY